MVNTWIVVQFIFIALWPLKLLLPRGSRTWLALRLEHTLSESLLKAQAIGQDNAPATYAAVRKMLHTHPGIGAIYGKGGGLAGLA